MLRPTRLFICILTPFTLLYLTGLTIHRVGRPSYSSTGLLSSWIPSSLSVTNLKEPTNQKDLEDDDSEEVEEQRFQVEQILSKRIERREVKFKAGNLINSNDDDAGPDEDNDLIHCDNITPRSHFGQRGSHYILYNYIQSTQRFNCNESITYTTHGDFRFIHNLIPLIDRWRGPISIALYAPGTDYDVTINRIWHLRNCSAAAAFIVKYVTFHLFFDTKHIPQTFSRAASDYYRKNPMNCTYVENVFYNYKSSFKLLRSLTYPVNVGRNVAKEMSTTLYVLPSDIELYPSPGLIPSFFDMLRRQVTNKYGKLARKEIKMKLFALPIFEVAANVSLTQLPMNKIELIKLLEKRIAITFHESVCQYCHIVPHYFEWVNTKTRISKELNVFAIGKRTGPFLHWEPIYIGTKFDPPYDERLSWEGRKDKMTQGYILCVLDYEFHILDNAFLIHRPGVKQTTEMDLAFMNPVVAKQDAYILSTILPELIKLYGYRKGCSV